MSFNIQITWRMDEYLSLNFKEQLFCKQNWHFQIDSEISFCQRAREQFTADLIRNNLPLMSFSISKIIQPPPYLSEVMRLTLALGLPVRTF